MTNTSTVIVCTAGAGFVVFVAGIALGWFGFPALIVQGIKQVSTAYKTSNNRGYVQRICFHAFINISRDMEIMAAKLGKAILVQAWRGPEGSRGLRLPDFMTVGI
jgi:hypothetical protein